MFMCEIMRDELYWLRVTGRINYKLCSFVYKAWFRARLLV